MQFDVIIIGGGPAGSVAALTLARGDVGVLMIERARSWQARPGETLPPTANKLLRRLGVWEDFLATHPVESPGNLSLWGDNEPRATDFIFSPYGSGWHVDRAAFDSMLARAAVDEGATLNISTLVVQAEWNGDQWMVRYRDGSGLHEAQSAWLIAATGRGGRSVIPNMRHIQTDRLCACFTLAPTQRGTDTRTWLEAESDGWWYSAPVPSGKIALAYFTDADLLPKSTDARRAWLKERIARTVLMRQRVSPRLTDWRAVDARSGYQEIPVSSQLLFVGDAALSLDPLSSSGLTFALESGYRAAVEVEGASVNESYSDWIARFYENYCEDYRRFYGREERWLSSTFWRRRTRRSALWLSGPRSAAKALKQ